MADFIENHFNKEEIIREDTFKYPGFSPAEWLSETPHYQATSRIRMTCGGGMGGAQWYLVVKRIPFRDIHPNSFLKVTDFEGKETLINTNFVVDVDNSLLVATADVDCKNPTCVLGVHRMNFLIEEGCMLSLKNYEDNF